MASIRSTASCERGSILRNINKYVSVSHRDPLAIATNRM
jgi:hypothetical protein